MLTIDVYHQQFTEAFAALQARAHDISPALHEIGYTLENMARGRFESQSDPLGHPWEPWKPSTVQSYPKDGHLRVLEQYGDMLGSLNYQADASNSSVRVGFGGEYATYHEWGTKHMERRGMLAVKPRHRRAGPRRCGNGHGHPAPASFHLIRFRRAHKKSRFPPAFSVLIL